MRHLSCPSMLLATLLLSACGVPLEDDTSSPLNADESLVSRTQAIDDACVNSGVVLAQPNGAAVNFQYTQCSPSRNSSATSNDGNYDQPLCRHRFVTEVQHVNNMRFSAYVEAVPASSTLTETACTSVLIIGSAWGFNGFSWVQLGSVTTTGIWHPATGRFPGYCQLFFPIGEMSSGYTKVRVMGLAAALGVFKFRVQTGVNSYMIIC